MTEFPARGQKAPAYWDLQLKAWIEEQIAASAATIPPSAFAPLKAMLDEAGPRPIGMQLIGDSTGNDATEWPRKLSDMLRPLYPAFTFQEASWNTGTEIMPTPTVLQTGTAGAQHLLVETGKSTPAIPHADAPAFPSVFDFRMKLAADDWSSAAANTVIAGRENGGGQRSWWVAINSAGFLQMVVSSDGTALTTIASTAAVSFTDAQTGWVRVVYTPNDGSGNRVTRFYTSTTGLTWTQLGATVTTAGAITPFAPSNAPLTIGGRGGGSGLPGKIYEVHILNGENGADLVPPLPGSWPMTPSGTNMSIVGAPVFTFVLGSHSGADSAMLADATRLAKMTPNYGQKVCFVSDSHNEAARVDAAFLTPYNTLIQGIQGRFPGVPLVLLTQNQENGATNQVSHAARRWNILTYAASKGYDAIDTYKAFADDPRGIAALLLDTIHPNEAGSTLWAETVRDVFLAA